MKKIILIVLVVVVAAVIVLFAFGNGDSSTDGGAKLVTVEKGEIIEKAMAIGQIEPFKEIAVKSKISGIVKKLYVEVGDTVRTGDALMDILPQPTPMEYTEAKRQLEIAEIEAANSERLYKRAEELWDKKLAPKEDFDSRKAQYEQDTLRLKLAQDRMQLLQEGALAASHDKKENTIRSPIDGTVLAKNVDEGDPVTPLTSYQDGTELLYLAEMSDLIFRGTVDEIDVGKLKAGMPATIKVGALPKDTVTGVLYKISPKARKEQSATVFDVEVNLATYGDINLRAGYSANAEIRIKEAHDILVIPERLIEFDSDTAYVYTLDSLGTETRKQIETGLSDGITIEIVSGLSEGDQVVEKPPKDLF
ncbi:MAG: efflux RND transporter periplasmic adaptor subunit [bacterium]